MATKQDAAPRAQRLAAIGAVALLAVATALAFGRVFLGAGTTWKLVGAALLSVALAAALERRSLVLATVVSALALLFAIGLLVFPHTTWWGLPTRQTLSSVTAALGQVGHDARVQVAPSEPLRPLVLAALTAVWTASFSAHALAIRAGSPLLAVLPPVALVGFADTVLEDGARPGYALLLLLAALLVVFTDGLRRIRQWGPLWSSPGRRRLSSVAGRGARRVGVTALVAALAFPGVLPGFRDEALVDFSTNSTQGTRLDPFASIRQGLVRDTAVPLYHVTATDAAGARFGLSYWRSYALDDFDGQNWYSSDLHGQDGTLLSAQTQLQQPVQPPDSAVTHVHEEVQLLTDQHDTALPVAYPAVGIDVPTLIRYDPGLGTVTVNGTLPAQSGYAVDSDVVIPTPEELDGASPLPSPSRQDVELPDTIRRAVGGIARQWAATATQPDPYRRILAIMDHFTSPEGPFRYSTKIDMRDDKNALVDFLTKTHRGFCVQFATAMAVLVRALGYPARVATGYRTGTPQGKSSFLVTSHDAHAWVEVYFHGYGWLPFEPTPTQPSPISNIDPSYLNPAASIRTDHGTDTTGGTGDGGTNGGDGNAKGCFIRGHPVPRQVCAQRNQQGRVRHTRFGAGQFRFSQPGDGYGVPIRVALSIVLLLALVFLVLVPAVKWAVRLRIAHRRAPPREMVLAAFRLFDGEAADVGLGRRPGETLSEYRLRLSERVRFSDGQIGRLTNAVTRAAYADGEVDPEAARAALRDARVAIRDVRREVGPVRRVVGVYRPGI